MAHPGKIRRLVTLPAGMEALRFEAAADGFRFMDKLQSDWETGRNRFDGPGEIFLGAFSGPRLLAVGGLNLDPYTTEAHAGRLRHVYVLKGARRQGIATALVRRLLNDARRSFRSVRLCTDTASGAMFYESLGFVPSSSSTASHEIAVSSRRVRAAEPSETGGASGGMGLLSREPHLPLLGMSQVNVAEPAG